MKTTVGELKRLVREAVTSQAFPEVDALVAQAKSTGTVATTTVAVGRTDALGRPIVLTVALEPSNGEWHAKVDHTSLGSKKKPEAAGRLLKKRLEFLSGQAGHHERDGEGARAADARAAGRNLDAARKLKG